MPKKKKSGKVKVGIISVRNPKSKKKSTVIYGKRKK